MQNQMVHSARVRRRSSGPQIELASPAGSAGAPRGPGAAGASAASSEISAREGAGEEAGFCVRVRGARTGGEDSRERTTASASSCRPEASRKRTDSGRPHRITSAHAAGTHPRARAHRQPLSEAPTTNAPISAAAIHPTAQNASSHTTIRPRIRRGENSEISVEATGSSAPKPRPTMNRKIIRTARDPDRAEAPVARP